MKRKMVVIGLAFSLSVFYVSCCNKSDNSPKQVVRPKQEFSLEDRARAELLLNELVACVDEKERGRRLSEFVAAHKKIKNISDSDNSPESGSKKDDPKG